MSEAFEQLQKEVQETARMVRQFAAAAAQREAESARRDKEREERMAQREAEAARREKEREEKMARREAEMERREAEIILREERHYERMARHEVEMARREKEREEKTARREAETARREKARDTKAERRERALRELADYARREKDSKDAIKRIEAVERARGRQAEDHFRRGCPEALKRIGIEVDEVVPHRLRLRGSDREYDLAARNGKIALTGEVKVHFQAKHLSRLRDLAAHFREDNPEFVGDRMVYGVVCGLAVDNDAAELARRDGLIVLTLDAKARMIVPDGADAFVPKAW